MKILKEPYGFIYITTNWINGKRYIGQKIFDNHGQWPSYLGSGVAIKNAIKKYGRKNFSKNIIYIAYSKEELNEKEKEYIQFFNAYDSFDFYNIAIGGEGYKVFGTELYDKSRIVYCVETGKAYKNSRIASIYNNEPAKSIYNKCKNFEMGLKNVKKGYHWVFLEQIYVILKGSYSSIPVIDLETNKIYASWIQAKKIKGSFNSRKSVINIERYYKMKKKNISVKSKLMRLDDYISLFENTEIYRRS